jgi:putative capsular polysaccharide synthesis protein
VKQFVANRQIQKLKDIIKYNLNDIYRRYFYVYRTVYLRSDTPIIIYSAPKTGTTSIEHTLSSPRDIYYFKVHTMDIEAIRERTERRRNKGINPRKSAQFHHSQQLYYHVAKAGRFAKYITLVRNPIDVHMSTFFQILHLYTDIKIAEAKYRVDELIEIYLAQLPNAAQVDPISWFEREMKGILDIDVYQHPFSHEQGYLCLQFPHADVLILKLETNDELKAGAIRGFLARPDLQFRRGNIAESKDYAEAYREFKQRIVLPAEYINGILDSKYMQHFYTRAEIEASRQRWLSKIRNQASKRLD